MNHTKHARKISACLAAVAGGALALAGASPAEAASAPQAEHTVTTTPIHRDLVLRQVKTSGRMVPWYGATANDTIVRVWPNQYSGDTWQFRSRGTVRTNDGHMWRTYSVYNVKSGKCLQPKDREAKKDAYLVIYDCDTASQAQDWVLISTGDKTFEIVPVKHTSLGITLQVPNAGANLKLDYRNVDNPAFDWTIDGG